VKPAIARPMLALAAVACLAAVAWRAGAANHQRTVAPKTAVAIVDVRKVILALKERELRLAEIDQKQAATRAELEKLKQALDALVESGKATGIKPGTPEFIDHQVKLLSIENEGRTKLAASQYLTATQQGFLLVDLHNKMVKAIQTISERDGWDLVLYDNRGASIIPDIKDIPEGASYDQVVDRAIQARRILYASSAVDITQDVITFMNNTFIANPGAQ